MALTLCSHNHIASELTSPKAMFTRQYFASAFASQNQEWVENTEKGANLSITPFLCLSSTPGFGL